MSLPTRTEASIPVPKLHDSKGNPTCCILWGDKDNTCPLLRTTGRFGVREICNWTDSELFRRLDDKGQEMGTIIPDARCPIHAR